MEHFFCARPLLSSPSLPIYSNSISIKTTQKTIISQGLAGARGRNLQLAASPHLGCNIVRYRFLKTGDWDLHHRHYTRISFSFNCLSVFSIAKCGWWKTMALFRQASAGWTGRWLADGLLVRNAQLSLFYCAHWIPPFCSWLEDSLLHFHKVGMFRY